jgi:alpha-beta hydrolase superfamily lysophospholipase
MTQDPVRIDFTSVGDVPIATYRWDPAGAPRAIAQIVHGVGDHAQRYGHVAEALTRAGHVVYAHDHRGHGNTSPAPADQGVLGEDGWGELVADIGRVGAIARAAHPGLPLVLVAHSLGSFATQQYLLDHSGDVDAVVLSGTASIDLLEPMMDLDAPMDLGMFNAAFQPPRTEFDWLSRDEAEVDKYSADPFTGFGLDIPGSKALFAGARRLVDPENVAAIRDDLPVLIVVGDMDPVNGQLALVTVLADRLRQAGLTDVTLRVHPQARHEVFNETNRDEVIADVVSWAERALLTRAAG